MRSKKLPSKLTTEPLIEAVFEVRFSGSTAGSVVLPGLLIGSLAGGREIRIEKLPAASLPDAMRRADPNLQFAPTIRMDWGDFSILIGDVNVAVACKLPYPGWTRFKTAILEVLSVASKATMWSGASRYSLKYVDLLPGEDRAAQIRRFDWDIRVGEHRLGSEVFSLRWEVPDADSTTHVIQILTSVSATLTDQSEGAGASVEKRGAILDIDSIVNFETSDISAFMGELPSRLDVIHANNKEIFFSCLRPETIEELGAEYDQ
jgi:uncharacterized protein (TIGR04255 family)